MKNLVNYSEYECPYSHVKKDCGHELNGPEGYEDTYGVWCACGFRGPVFYLDPKELGLKLKGEKQQKLPEWSEELWENAVDWYDSVRGDDYWLYARIGYEYARHLMEGEDS